ncbi:MAG: LexA family protein [Pyrinomonadaceae bacterium]
MNVAAVWARDARAVRLLRPLFVARVSAGFPSPAEDWVEGRLDLNRYLVRHPAATFFVRVSGDSMIGAGINCDDILIVDRAAEADDGDVVIARLNNELTVKRLRVRDDGIWLMPENEEYEPIHVNEEMDFEVWGKVCHVIHSL